MGTRLGSEMRRAQPGRWVRRKASLTKSTPVGVSPPGLGASGALSPKARPEGLGTGFRRGPYCLVILLPSLHGTATLGQQATTDHTGSLGTVPKGQSGHSEWMIRKAILNSVPAAGPLCTCRLGPTPADRLLSSCSRGWGGQARVCRWGPGAAVSHSIPSLQTRAGSWGHIKSPGAANLTVAPS